MDSLTVFFVVAGALVAVLANISVWAPRKVWVKATALLTTALFLPAAYISLADLLSRPKPIEIQWGNLDLAEATVIGSSMKEGEAIYLWLGLEGLEEPRAYALPWDQEMAQQLYDAKRAAEAEGNGVRMSMPFERSWDKRERRFYAAPQPPTPDKHKQKDQPFIFEKSDGKTKSDET
jgi:hypothetical protein